MTVRLNKLLAQRGLGARRKCDELIQSGVVRVNGSVVTEPGTQVEPGRDKILVRGRPLPSEPELRYYVLNKPVGVITTLSDPEGRRTIREFLPPGTRLFPVGRLDADTSGLLVLTNDGELAHHLMHPRYGVEKIYRVRLDRPPDARQLGRLRTGVEFEPGVVSSPARVRILHGADAMIEIALHEGRYRQVRRMCEAVGLAVSGLHRAAYGPLRLGPLTRGIWRELSDEEVRRLRAASARPRARGLRPGRYFGGARRRGEGATDGGPQRGSARERGAVPRQDRAHRPERTSRPAAERVPSRPARAERGRSAPARGAEGPRLRREPNRGGGEERGQRPPFDRRNEGTRAGAAARRPRFDRPRGRDRNGARVERPRFDRPTYRGREGARVERPPFDRPRGRNLNQRGERPAGPQRERTERSFVERPRRAFVPGGRSPRGRFGQEPRTKSSERRPSTRRPRAGENARRPERPRPVRSPRTRGRSPRG